jgi:hypothetical protein
MNQRHALFLALFVLLTTFGCTRQIDQVSAGSDKTPYMGASMSGSPLPNEVGTVSIDGKVMGEIHELNSAKTWDVKPGAHTIRLTTTQAPGDWSASPTLDYGGKCIIDCPCKPNHVTINTDAGLFLDKGVTKIITSIGGVIQSPPIEPGGTATYEVSPGFHVPITFSDQNGTPFSSAVADLAYDGKLTVTVK